MPENKNVLWACLSLFISFVMLSRTYEEYNAYMAQGAVTSLKGELAVSGSGAISMLLGYLLITLVLFSYSFTFFRDKRKK